MRGAMTNLRSICGSMAALATMIAISASHPAAAAETVEPHIVRLDAGLDALIAPGTQIERVATGFKFTEGPMWREGRLWFSDLRDDKMLATTPQGQVEVLIKNAGGVHL